MRFTDLKLPEEQARRVTVDVSRWLGPGAEIVFVEPDVPTLFRVAEEATQYLRNNPGWPESLCRFVSLLANSHAEPAPEPGDEPIGLFYCRLVKQSPSLFGYLSNRYNEGFPAIADFDGAAEDEKKGEAE